MSRDTWLLDKETAIGSSEVEYRTLERYPGYRFGSDGSVWCARRPNKKHGWVLGQWRRVKGYLTEGYPMLCIGMPGGQVDRKHFHSLIAEAFHGPCPDGMEVCHFPDGTRTNCAAANLKYATRKENHSHKAIQGTAVRGERCHTAKLTEGMVRDARHRAAKGEPTHLIARSMQVRSKTVLRAVKGETWSWLV